MTPAGTSNELDVQNGWEENTHTHRQDFFPIKSVTKSFKSLTAKCWHENLVEIFKDFVTTKTGITFLEFSKMYNYQYCPLEKYALYMLVFKKLVGQLFVRLRLIGKSPLRLIGKSPAHQVHIDSSVGTR